MTRGMPIATVDLEAYFKRIQYTGPRVATLDVLSALHFLHVCAIPFENLDVLLGRGIDLDLAAIERKLIRQGRGGYCFEQNSLFAAVLRQLGFDVTTLAARVRWQVPADVVLPRTHMMLLVTIDGIRHVADVGFGGLSLSAPIRLDDESPQTTPHSQRRLLRDGDERVHQVFRHDTWLDVYRFTLEPHSAVDYELANWFTSTHPRSRFRQNLIVARAARDRHYTLANREFTVRHNDGRVEKRSLETADELLAVLADPFGLTFPADTRFGPNGSAWPA
jgi:N-hydroxyarylamine O-acetyltransferase